jgi:ribosomal protein L7/L12
VIFYWLTGLALVLLWAWLRRRGERVDASVKQLGGSTPRAPADIDALIQSGYKIDAIKLYRELHGVDLKAAKDAIDVRARQLGR